MAEKIIKETVQRRAEAIYYENIMGGIEDDSLANWVRAELELGVHSSQVAVASYYVSERRRLLGLSDDPESIWRQQRIELFVSRTRHQVSLSY